MGQVGSKRSRANAKLAYSRSQSEPTKVRALKVARDLLQRYGYNGFSFQHIADALKIQKPSLYAHYSSKEELGFALIEKYREDFEKWTETIEIFAPQDKICAYFSLFFKFYSDEEKYCPLSVLIGDYHTLPKSIKSGVEQMFESQRQWLQKVVSEGQRLKVFDNPSPSRNLACTIQAMGLGSQMVARVSHKSSAVSQIQQEALCLLSSKRKKDV